MRILATLVLFLIGFCASARASADAKFIVSDSTRFETVEISETSFLVRDKANSFSGLIVQTAELSATDRKELELNFKSYQQSLSDSGSFEIQSVGPGLEKAKSDTVRYRTLLKELGGTLALNEDYVFATSGQFTIFFISQLKDERHALDARDFIESKLRSSKSARAAFRELEFFTRFFVDRADAKEVGGSRTSNVVSTGNSPDPDCLKAGIKDRNNIRRTGEKFSRMTVRNVADKCGAGIGKVLEATALSFAPGNTKWNKAIGMSDQTAEDVFMLLPGPVGLLNSTDHTLQGLAGLKDRFLSWWSANHGEVMRALQLALEVTAYSPRGPQSAVELNHLIAKNASIAANRLQCLRPDVQVKLVCEVAATLAEMATGKVAMSAMARSRMLSTSVGGAVNELIDTSASDSRLARLTTRASVTAAKKIESAPAVQKPILVIASRSRRLRELTGEPIVKPAALADAVKLSEAPVRSFVKDAPTYAYRITSDRFEDIPEAIRSHLGEVDKTTYTPEYLAQNKGSVIAMQMDGDKPDFYIISKADFEKEYSVVSVESVKAKNAKYVLDLRSNVPVGSDPNIVGIIQNNPVQMVKMSEVGFALDKEATIEAPWGGTQTKPAGEDAFLVYDKATKNYYMVNDDKNGLPLHYVKHVSRVEKAQAKIAAAAEGRPAYGKTVLRDRTFEHRDITSQAIGTKMADFKYLDRTLQDFTNDTNIPLRLRRLVQDAVKGDASQVQIVKLTDELRKEYLIPDNFSAFLWSKNRFYVVSRKEKTANAVATDLQSGITADPRKPYPYTARKTVLVPERPIGPTNDLATLVHELAHVRFYKWFEKNLPALAKKNSEFIKRSPNGDYLIDDQFVTYVNERYAHESEFQAYKAAEGRHFDRPSPRWLRAVTLDENQVRRELSDYVSNQYGVTDPRLRSLRDKKLSEILLSDQFIEQADH